MRPGVVAPDPTHCESNDDYTLLDTPAQKNKLSVYFVVCPADWPNCLAGRQLLADGAGLRDWLVEARSVVAQLVAANTRPSFRSLAAYGLGLHVYVDYRVEWKKTTELKIGTTMAMFGSKYMLFKQHSRTGLRPVGSYSGKDDRWMMFQHLGPHGWNLFDETEVCANNPIRARGGQRGGQRGRRERRRR